MDGNEWEKHFKNLYTKDNDNDIDEIDILGEIIDFNNDKLNLPFTIKELTDTIKNLKNNKSPGYDGIYGEFLKLYDDRILNLILHYMNLVLSKNTITSNWCLDIISPIHKEGIKSNPDNYRGISLINILLKILCTMMNNRLNEYCQENNIINEGQIGFKKGSRTSDHILTLRTIINKYVYDKNEKIYACFVDFRKAFDTVCHKYLYQKLKKTI